MTHYEKLTVDRFASNLTEGKYKNLTGARRAIGKTASWSAKEKEKATAIADKHFGTEGAASSAPKTAKKAATKAPAKKAAAVAGPGRGRKAKAAGTSAAPAAKTLAKKAATRRSPVTRGAHHAEVGGHESHASVGERTLLSSSPENINDAIRVGTQLVEFAGRLREQTKLLKTDAPTVNAGQVVDEVNNILSKAARLVNRQIPEGPGGAELPAQRIAVSPPSNGTSSLEEQRMADVLSNVKPASTISELPRPVSS